VVANDVKASVRAQYGRVARESTGCCGPGGGCRGGETGEERGIPAGADLGLGCGNPTAIAGLKAGETVLDLGSGAGVDCFLAAGKVGKAGRVIGVDFTDEMLDRARQNASEGDYPQVEFRKKDIEALPVADETVDVVLSNCVLNLVPDKRRAFAELYRVLKPGGRMTISDIVLERPLPEAIRADLVAYAACISGALLREEYLDLLRGAGLEAVTVERETDAGAMLACTPGPVSEYFRHGVSEAELTGWVTSLHITACKGVPT